MRVRMSPRASSTLCLGIAAALGLSACDDGPSIDEALAKAEEEKFEYKPNPKPRPDGLAGPSEAEFKAWDRKDPEGEKHLYKWDQANLDPMLRYWHELECFREEVKEAGVQAFGAEPGSPKEEQWYQFKRAFVTHVDGWQKRLFAEQPRVLEKSKFIGNFLEAHEMVMHGYPKAYNSGDKVELEKADAHWAIIEAKISKYVKNLGGEYPERDPENEKVMAAHAKFCEEAMKPPERGKVKKRRSRKSPI